MECRVAQRGAACGAFGGLPKHRRSGLGGLARATECYYRAHRRQIVGRHALRRYAPALSACRAQRRPPERPRRSVVHRRRRCRCLLRRWPPYSSNCRRRAPSPSPRRRPRGLGSTYSLVAPCDSRVKPKAIRSTQIIFIRPLVLADVRGGFHTPLRPVMVRDYGRL